MEKLLTVPQVAELLGCHKQSVYARISRGVIPVVRLGGRTVRVRPADLERYIRDRLNVRGRLNEGDDDA